MGIFTKVSTYMYFTRVDIGSFTGDKLDRNLVLFCFKSLKEYATNEETFTAFVQDVSHNINLMRIGKWRRLNRISLRLNIPAQRFYFA